MASIRKCAKCGLDLTDPSASLCPMCGTKIVAPPGAKIWIGALLQFAIAATFMLVFKFPKILIAVFGAMILIGTALSAWIRPRQAAASRAPQRPLSHPVRFRVLSLGIALCSFAFLCILLFGFVIFINAWNRWHQYEGQPYRRSDFQVERVYYQKGSKGGVSAYARGTVEGQREWMDLRPYLFGTPRSQAELEEQVPEGTTIPVYLFPELKGRARVQVLADVLPDEANRRTAMNALHNGLLGLAVTAGLIFVLSRLRRSCYAEPAASFSAEHPQATIV